MQGHELHASREFWQQQTKIITFDAVSQADPFGLFYLGSIGGVHLAGKSVFEGARASAKNTQRLQTVSGHVELPSPIASAAPSRGSVTLVDSAGSLAALNAAIRALSGQPGSAVALDLEGDLAAGSVVLAQLGLPDGSIFVLDFLGDMASQCREELRCYEIRDVLPFGSTHLDSGGPFFPRLQASGGVRRGRQGGLWRLERLPGPPDVPGRHEGQCRAAAAGRLSGPLPDLDQVRGTFGSLPAKPMDANRSPASGPVDPRAAHA